MQTITHPVSGAIIEGDRLAPGTVIERGDRYDSTSGGWDTNYHFEGRKVPEGDHVIWVRPSSQYVYIPPKREPGLGWEISEDAKQRLADIESHIVHAPHPFRPVRGY